MGDLEYNLTQLELVTRFIDESQEIITQYEYKTDKIEYRREKIECSKEYFKRKLTGK